MREASEHLGQRALFLGLGLLALLSACAGSSAAARRGSVQSGGVNGLAHNGIDADAARWSRSAESRSVQSPLFADTDDDGLPDMRVRSKAEPAAQDARMLIYAGSLLVEVARVEDASRAFLAEVEARGGYLQSQSGAELTVRVPADRFDELFVLARGSGRVLAESRNARDVTEEFVDLELRVDNARQSRQRLLEVLKLATEVEDILKVESELRRLTEEIERMEGRLKFLRDQVAMATLEVGFRSAQVAPQVRRGQRPSRFGWINRVGADAVMRGF